MSKVDEKYFELLKEVLEKGYKKETRAGETLSVFSKHLEFDLKDGFPILTTKKVFTRGFIHETLWMLKGDTNIKYLVDNNVHIWDADAYRHYCDLVNKHNEKEKIYSAMKPNIIDILSKEDFIENVKNGTQLILSYGIYIFGDLGPVYGKQWRNYGFSHKDQIKDLIKKLKENPDDRRMICWAFNQDEFDKMALPPCHMGFEVYSRKLSLEERQQWMRENTEVSQSYISKITQDEMTEMNVPQRELSLCWIQRSCDLPLGWAGNLTMYSLILSMLAQIVNMTVGKVSCWLGDAHIYTNQIEGIYEQLKNDPKKYGLPKLCLNPNITNITNFTIDDIKIEGYESYPKVNFPLSVG